MPASFMRRRTRAAVYRPTFFGSNRSNAFRYAGRFLRMVDQLSPAWAPSIVTPIPVMGTPDSFAYVSIRVTPQDETPARNASLFVNASGWGRDDESRTRRCPRASLRARPRTPLLEDRTASIFMSLTLIPPLRFCRSTSRYITPGAVSVQACLFPEGPGPLIPYDGF